MASTSASRRRTRLAAGRRGVQSAPDAGFSLVEVMVAMLVFGLISLVASSLVIDALGTTRDDQSRVRAAALAARDLETVRADFRSLAKGPTFVTSAAYDEVVDSRAFTVTRTVTPLPGDGVTSGDRLQVSVVVTWPQMGGVKPVVNSTLLTAQTLVAAPGEPDPPGDDPIEPPAPGSGAVQVRVLGADSQGNAGLDVRLTRGASTLSRQTGPTGAATFPGLAPGDYTVRVKTDGYISDLGLDKAEAPVAVAAGATEQIDLRYDEYATLNLTVTGQDSTHQVATGAAYPLSVLNMGIVGAAARTTLQPTSSTATTTTRVWPSPSGVLPWAGTCDNGNPGASGIVAVAPGATANHAVQLGRVKATITGNFLVLGTGPVKNAQVVGVKAAGPGCAATVTDPVTGGEVGSVVRFPESTNNSGVARVALPPGVWTIKVIGQSPPVISGGWPTVAIGTGSPADVPIKVGGLL